MSGFNTSCFWSRNTIRDGDIKWRRVLISVALCLLVMLVVAVGMALWLYSRFK